ncbi:MAG: TatA/E family twin arginine-targeting protein translocase [Anaerolineae bacterium]
MNFLGIGPMELLLILIIALIIFGPGKLPEIGSAIGKGLREFKQASEEITTEITQEMESLSEAATGQKKNEKSETEEKSTK